jgi:phosphatidate phosphatase PAH1
LRIGKLRSLNFDKTIIELKVNGTLVDEVMFVDKNGGAYFLLDED